MLSSIINFLGLQAKMLIMLALSMKWKETEPMFHKLNISSSPWVGKKLSRCFIMKHRLSFLLSPGRKKTVLVHETSARFLSRPKGDEELLVHETSAQFLSLLSF